MLEPSLPLVGLLDRRQGFEFFWRRKRIFMGLVLTFYLYHWIWTAVKLILRTADKNMLKRQTLRSWARGYPWSFCWSSIEYRPKSDWLAIRFHTSRDYRPGNWFSTIRHDDSTISWQEPAMMNRIRFDCSHSFRFGISTSWSWTRLIDQSLCRDHFFSIWLLHGQSRREFEWKS